jgi:WhiB family transcriptional regulator, redox-sensing transcriptional regulator
MSTSSLGLLGSDLDLTMDGVRLRTPRPGWRTRAACSDLDDGPFAGQHVLSKEAEQLAREVCEHCAVREECLAFALAHGVRHGVWGGFNHDERRRLRRRWLDLRDAEATRRSLATTP